APQAIAPAGRSRSPHPRPGAAARTKDRARSRGLRGGKRPIVAGRDRTASAVPGGSRQFRPLAPRVEGALSSTAGDSLPAHPRHAARAPPELRRELVAEAAEQGVSLNRLITGSAPDGREERAPAGSRSRRASPTGSEQQLPADGRPASERSVAG